MILVRSVLQAQFGRGGELAALMTQANRGLAQAASFNPTWRVLTDLSGSYDTVVLELEMESLAEWERRRADLFAQPLFRELMPRMQELVVSGRNEYYTIETES